MDITLCNNGHTASFDKTRAAGKPGWNQEDNKTQIANHYFSHLRKLNNATQFSLQ